MGKLKWWHWVLIAFGGPAVLSSIAPRPLSNLPMAPSPAPSATFADAKPRIELISGDAVFAMTFDAAADPQSLPDLARVQCGEHAFCKVMGWTNPKYAARGFPMTDREAADPAQAACAREAPCIPIAQHALILSEDRRWSAQMEISFDTERRTRAAIALHRDLAASAHDAKVRQHHLIRTGQLGSLMPQSAAEPLLLTLK